MKTMTVRELQQNIRQCVDDAQKDRVVLTRHGKPAAILVGVEGKDWEDVFYETDSSFWKMIEKRRAERTVSLEDVKKHLGIKTRRPH